LQFGDAGYDTWSGHKDQFVRDVLNRVRERDPLLVPYYEGKLSPYIFWDYRSWLQAHNLRYELV
jgi:hypothetical protein